MMQFFDSHCHLEEDMIPIIQASETKRVVNIGCDLKSSLESVRWSSRFPWVYGTVGIHPEFANETDAAIGKIKELIAKHRYQPGDIQHRYQANDMQDLQTSSDEDTKSQRGKIVAIGEIGLDYHWQDNPPRDVQRYCFETQIELAKELSMPICIHSRDADQETMDILKAHKAFDNIPVLMHCFSGSNELAKQYIKLGAWISIAGPVTYKNNKKTVQVAAEVPLDRLLIETDSPYLTPVPLRGQSNTPANVKYTAAKIAEIKGISLEELATASYTNACRFYRIKDN